METIEQRLARREEHMKTMENHMASLALVNHWLEDYVTILEAYIKDHGGLDQIYEKRHETKNKQDD